MHMKTDPGVLSHNEVDELPSLAAAGSTKLPLTEPSLMQRQRAVLRELFQLIAERAGAEPLIDGEFKTDITAIEDEFEVAFQDNIILFATEKEAVEKEAQEARQRITAWYESERAVLEKEVAEARVKINGRYEREKHDAKAEYQETRWTINAAYEGSKGGSEKRLHDDQKRLADAIQRIETIDAETRDYLTDCRQIREWAPVTPPASTPESGKEPLDQLQDYLTFADWKLLDTTTLLDPAIVTNQLRAALEGAEAFVARMPSEQAGLLFIEGARVVQPDPARLGDYQTHAGQRHGQWNHYHPREYHGARQRGSP